MDRGAADRRERCVSRQWELRQPLAERGLAAGALRAEAARADERDDDVVAGGDAEHVRPHLLDDTRSLVPVHRRQLASPRALHESDVAVTDGAGPEPHADLAHAWPTQRNLLDAERLPERVADR